MLSRPVSLVVAAAAGAATLTAASAPSPLYPVYQRLWNLPTFVLTVVFAAYVIALLVALLTVGSLSDSVGRRPVASTALVLLALGTLLFTVAGGAGGLVVARVVQGFAVGAATGTTTALITDLAPDPRSGALLSSAAPSLGITVGTLLAGALVQFAPAPRQLVFWVLASVYLVLAGLVWCIPGDTRPTPSTRGRLWRSLVPSAGLPSSARPVFFALVPSICATWALSGLYLSLGSSILATVLGVHSHFSVGLVLGAFFAAGTGGTLGSAVVPRRACERLADGSLLLGVVLTVAATHSRALPLYVVGSVVAGLGFGAAFRLAVDALGEAAPGAQRGQVFATMYIVSYLAFSVPALVAGLAVEPLGLQATAVGYGALEVLLVLAATAISAVRAHRHSSAVEPRPAVGPDPLSGAAGPADPR